MKKIENKEKKNKESQKDKKDKELDSTAQLKVIKTKRWVDFKAQIKVQNIADV